MEEYAYAAIYVLSFVIAGLIAYCRKDYRKLEMEAAIARNIAIAKRYAPHQT